MTQPFDAYSMYNALKLHFEQDSYDAIKYNFKSNVTPKSFFARKDKYFFAKLAKTYDDKLLQYYIANFKNGVSYVGDMLNEGGESNFKEHMKVRESIHREFQKDINTLIDMDKEFDSFFEAKQTHPLIIKLLMREEINLETVAILDSILGFMDREGSKITETIIWPDIYRKVMKYKPFVDFNKAKCIDIIKKGFTKP
tara:strand:- start:2968 stop:3558 length:591 start_codon:yes stop_codon:yes gene_type:complete